MALFAKLKDKRLREQMVQLLSSHPAWNKFLFEKHWICPYCMKAALQNAKNTPGFPDRVFGHLKTCSSWKEFTGTMHAPLEIESMVVKAQVTQHIKDNPAWRVRDSAGNWYCPFCARATQVTFEANKITGHAINSIITHLDRCYAYDHGKGQPQTMQYIQTVLQGTDRIRRLQGTIFEKMASDPLWKMKSERHKWACPYCRQIVDSVDMSSEFLTNSVAPREVAKHLVDSCPGYKGGKGALATAEEMENLVSNGRKKKSDERQPRHTTVVTRPPVEQDSVMFQAIRAELDAVRSAMSQSRENTEHHDEMQRSLEKAAQQQRTMLPDIPNYAGLDFEVLFQPMSTVSGDFYDFVKVSENEVGIVVGDVSGHGMEAALVMSMTKKSLKIHGKGNPSAAEVMRVTNADVYEDMAQSTFVSIFYGILNIETKIIRFCRAGHSPLVLFNPLRDPSLYALEPKGLAVGIDKGPVFNRTLEEMELQLVSGDMLVQFTDGVVEANNPKKEEFGLEELYNTIKEYGSHEPKYLAHMIDITLKEFMGPVPPVDDVTVLCVKIP